MKPISIFKKKINKNKQDNQCPADCHIFKKRIVGGIDVMTPAECIICKRERED